MVAAIIVYVIVGIKSYLRSCLEINTLPSTVVVQQLSRFWLFVTSWTAAHQASLPFIVSQRLFSLMSFEPVMPSNYLILCHPLLLLSLIFPSIRSFPMCRLCIRRTSMLIYFCLINTWTNNKELSSWRNPEKVRDSMVDITTHPYLSPLHSELAKTKPVTLKSTPLSALVDLVDFLYYSIFNFTYFFSHYYYFFSLSCFRFKLLFFSCFLK